MWNMDQLEADASTIAQPEIADALAALRAEIGTLAGAAIATGGSIIANRLVGVHKALTNYLSNALPATEATSIEVGSQVATTAVEQAVEIAAPTILEKVEAAVEAALRKEG
jgi:hypothetical protein